MTIASLRHEVRSLFALAAPIVVVQVGLMTMGVVDTLMVGRISAAALAAVALGNLYTWAVLVFGMGVVMALDPIVAQAIGARDREGAARGMQRGLILALALCVPAIALMFPAEKFFEWTRQPAEVIPVAATYVRISAVGAFPMLAFGVLRQGLQAMERTRPIVLAVVAGNVVNALLNWILIFGHLGFAPAGAAGSAWATATSRWAMSLGLLLLDWRDLRSMLLPFHSEALALRPLLRMLRVGFPIGLQFVLELGAFGAIALLMGSLGTIDVAAHQIAINLASLTFMVPLGVSAAAAVRVGHAVGRADVAAARRSARAALTLGVAFMTAMAALLVAAPRFLVHLYTPEAAVVAVAALLVPIAGFFQVFDGIQVVATGVLRGLGDTRAPMLVNVLGFWLVGLPVSLWLAFRLDTGPEGLWWGLVAGLAAVAALLVVRMVERLKGPVARVQVESRADAASAAIDAS